MYTLVIFLSHFISSFIAILTMSGLIALFNRNDPQVNSMLAGSFYYYVIYLLTSWILHYQLLMRATHSSFVKWIRKNKAVYFAIAVLGSVAFFYLTRGTHFFSVFTNQMPFLLLTSGFYFLVYDEKPKADRLELDELRDKSSWQSTLKDFFLIITIGAAVLVVKIIIFYLAYDKLEMLGLISLVIHNPFIIIFLVLLQLFYFEKALYGIREFLCDNLIVILNSIFLAGLFILHNDLFVIPNIVLALLCVQIFDLLRRNANTTNNQVV